MVSGVKLSMKPSLFFEISLFFAIFNSSTFLVDTGNAPQYVMRTVKGLTNKQLGGQTMSALTRYFSILMLGSMGFFGISAYALTTTNTDELYSDSLKLERSSAEVPSSIDTSALNPSNEGEEYVVDSTLESMSDVEAAQSASKSTKADKKASSKLLKAKKSSKN